MLNSIGLINFLSVQNSKIELSPSRIDILIGANGSGKSNFVKALEFIAELNKNGVYRAIYNAGGSEAILPKSITKKEMKTSKTEISYSVELHKPDTYSGNAKPPIVSHLLEISWKPKGKFVISREILEFSEPISIARAIKLGSARQKNGRQIQGKRAQDKTEYVPSIVKIERAPTRTCKISTMPVLDKQNVKDYITWFGFDTVLEKSPVLQTPSGFNTFLKSISKRYACQRTESLFEGSSVDILNFCAHFKIFRDTVNEIRRYDLQLSELRKEQPVSGSGQMGSEGQYLPEVVRGIGGRQDISLRLKETLKSIAPHIIDYSVNTLQTGKEYLEFLETNLGRPVESWSSSDGTLRSLAILLALETHCANQTLIIEEPELCLHPWSIRSLLNHAQDLVKKESFQVIFTSHSQQVLENVSPDQVILVSRTLAEGTKYGRISDFVSTENVSMGEVGRLWVKGLLGGVPHYE